MNLHSLTLSATWPFFPLPFPFPLNILLSVVGAGRDGFPLPRDALDSAAAAEAAACDCWITLKSLTTCWLISNSVTVE